MASRLEQGSLVTVFDVGQIHRVQANLRFPDSELPNESALGTGRVYALTSRFGEWRERVRLVAELAQP
jgi:hypothetical protein